MIASGLRIACLALVLVASPAYAETIRNAAYRFTLSKPDGWHDLSSGALAASLRPVDKTNATETSMVANAAVLAFSKYKEPTDELNSTFMMFGIHVGPAARSIPPTRALYGAIGNVMKIGANATVVSPPKDTTVGGLPAAHARVVVEIAHAGRTYQSETDLWCVVRGDSVLLIQIQAKRDDKKAGMDKLRAAVKSIRFER